MAIPICIPLRSIEDYLRQNVRYPGMDGLRATRDAIRRLPTPDEAIGNLVQKLDTLLAPLRGFLLIAELLLAAVNCLSAVTDALTDMSLDPISSCVEGLQSALSRLAQFIPPVPYLIAIGDILLALILYLDELRRALADLDARITAIESARRRGQDLNNARITLHADCAQEDLDAMRRHVLGAMETIGRTAGVLIAIVALIRSGGDVDQAQADIRAQNDTLASPASQAQTSLAAIDDALQALRRPLAAAHRLIMTPLGEFLEPASAPPLTLVNG